MSAALPWIITTGVVLGSAFCLWLFAGRIEEAHDELRAVKSDLESIKVWAAETFGGPEPLALVDPPTEPILLDTEPQPKIDLAGGARKPTPYKRGPRHAA